MQHVASIGPLAAKSGKMPAGELSIVKGKGFELRSKGGPTCNELDPDLIAGLAVPAVLLIVWLGVKRIRRMVAGASERAAGKS